MSSQDRLAEPVHSLLIPLGGWGLLVPSALIAEVVPDPQWVSVPHGERWLLGFMGWRSRPVPVMTLNPLLGVAMPAPDRHARAVMFYPLPGRPGRDFFAILSASEPQPRVLEDGHDFGAPVNAPERLGLAYEKSGGLILIPDLASLSRTFYPVT